MPAAPPTIEICAMLMNDAISMLLFSLITHTKFQVPLTKRGVHDRHSPPTLAGSGLPGYTSHVPIWTLALQVRDSLQAFVRLLLRLGLVSWWGNCRVNPTKFPDPTPELLHFCCGDRRVPSL